MCGGGPSASDMAREQEKVERRLKAETEAKRVEEEFRTLERKRGSAEASAQRRRSQETLLAAGLVDDEIRGPAGTILGGG